MTHVAASSNWLLAGMAPEDFQALSPDLERLDLKHHFVLEVADRRIENVYFPETAVGSIVALNAAGDQIEAGLFGREGMSAMAVVLGSDQSPNQSVIQIAGVCLRLPVDRLRDAMRDSASLTALLLAYAFSMSIQTAQTVLSDGRQTLEGRLGRWLLMCQDRIDGDLFLTHEYMSVMLGVRRPGVTLAVQALESRGLIRASRSTIHIVDRAGLIGLAGAFYGIPEQEYRRLVRAQPSDDEQEQPGSLVPAN